MSLLIKGMKMPTTPEKCTFYENAPFRPYPHCKVHFGGNCFFPDNCPLIEVPPHGRLIDADAFLALVNDTTILSDVVKYIINPLIMGEPTVVEAEAGEP